MIAAIVSAIFQVISYIIQIVLYPIDALITNALPSLASGIAAVSSFLSICTRHIGWVLSAIGLSSECISFIVLYFTFKLTFPITVYTIKLAIRWYNKIKV